MNEDNYINILIESLEEKSRVLDEVILCDREQMEIVRSKNPDLKLLEKSIDKIGELAGKIDRLNDGFESVYAKARDALLNHKEEHRSQILKLKELITTVTEKSVKIQAEEARNREAVSALFKGKRKELSDRRRSVQAMNKYSNSMRKINTHDSSVFWDNKK